MSQVVKTFKGFFETRFVAENKHLKFDFFQNLSEMAAPGAGDIGDIVRTPVNIDHDDIEFLHQFPPQYWSSASKQRYDMLYKGIEDLHMERMDMGFDSLQGAILLAMKNQNWNNLYNWKTPNGEKIDPQYVEKIKEESNPQNISNLSEKQLEDEAHKHAYEYVKSKTERIKLPNEPMEFKFRKVKSQSRVDGNPKSSITIKAKPFLNRLYHKLERTKDQPHPQDSGLGGTGKYGYDLAFPIEDGENKITRGMKFPTETSAATVMNKFLNLNQHRMFGDLPADAKWMPVHSGNAQLTDNFAGEHFEKAMTKKIISDFKKQGKFATNVEREKEARALAHEMTVKYIQEHPGEIRGAPVPGIAPEGIPLKVHNGKIIDPPLYLPHQKKIIHTGDGPEEHWVPIVNPAHYFRELGTHESDFHKDEEGNIKSPEEAGYAVPENMKRGYQKDFVHLKGDADPNNPDTPYYRKGVLGHMASGAYHFNQNSKARFFVSPGDPEFEKLKHAYLDEQGMIQDKEGSTLYKDFYKGIMNCASSSYCGDATRHERNIILQNVGEIHAIVVQDALRGLRDPRLKTPKRRTEFAKDRTAYFAQQNLGNETRRRRILDGGMKAVSRDATVSGKDGEMGIGDTLDAQAKNKGGLGTGENDPTRNYTARKAGDRILQTGEHQYAYSLDSLRMSITKMKADANKVDALSKAAILQATDIQKLKDAILDRVEVMDKVKELLVGLYAKSGNANAEEQADDQIKSWIEDGAGNSSSLVAAFENHPLVKNAIAGQNANIQGSTNPEELEPAMHQFRKDLEILRREKGEETAQAMFKADPPHKSRYVNGIIAPMFASIRDSDTKEYEDILNAIQAKINKEMQAQIVAKNTPLATAAREIQKAPIGQGPLSVKNRNLGAGPLASLRKTEPSNWEDLLKEKKFMDLAHHPEFAKQGREGHFHHLMKWLDNNKSTLPTDKYSSARDNMLRAWKDKTGMDYE